MPDALDVPDDLVTLERARAGAWDELITYSTRISIERRDLFPDPGQIVERQTWPPEQAVVLEELRDAYDGAARAVRHHPVMVRALEERCHYATELALRAAAKNSAATAV